MSLYKYIERKLSKLSISIQIFSTICLVFFDVYSFYKSNLVLAWVLLTLVIVSILIFLVKYRMERRRPNRFKINIPTSSFRGIYLKGLSAFEEGEVLLGRDIERKEVYSLINSSQFSFGYITGEAGAGKSSFIQCVVLSEIRDLEMFPVFVELKGGDPIDSINQSICSILEKKTIGSDLHKNVIRLRKKVGKQLVIIIDQFEKFFVGVKDSNERQEILKLIAKLTMLKGGAIKILICLRREFVGELNEFYPHVSQPTDPRFGLVINNWNLEKAQEVFQVIRESDGLTFSDELCDELLMDLSKYGTVKPIEFQIVSSKLKELGVNEISQYNKIGRSHGVLANFIDDLISTNTGVLNELQKPIALLVLKLLCDEERDIKRVKDLNFDRLFELTLGTLKNFDGTNYPPDILVNFHYNYNKIIELLLSKSLIKSHPNGELSLIHDYVVPAIRIANAKNETSEEKANRLLKRSIERFVLYKSRLPLKDYRFIKKYAASDIKKTRLSRKLFKISIRRYFILFFAASVLAITLIFPPRINYDIIHNVEHGNISWSTSNDGYVLVGRTNKKTFLYLLSENQRSYSKAILPHFTFIETSSNGQWLYAVNKNRCYLYEIELSKNNIRLISTTLGGMYSDISQGFVGNEYLYWVNKSGDLFLEYLDKRNVNPQPFRKNFIENGGHLPAAHSYHIWPSKNEKLLYGYQVVEVPREIDYEGYNRNLVSIDLENHEELKIKTLLPNIPNTDQRGTIKISDDDSLIAIAVHSSVVVVKLKDSSGYDLIADFSEKSKEGLNDLELFGNQFTDNSHKNLSFSPDNKWLFARKNSSMTIALSLVYDSLFILDNAIDQSTYHGTEFHYDHECDYVSFKDKNRNLYLVNLDSIVSKNGQFKEIVDNNKYFNKEFTFCRKSDSRIKFSPDNQWIAMNDVAGNVYTWIKESKPNLDEPLVYYDDRNDIDFKWSKTNNFLYTYSNNRLHYGVASEDLNEINLNIKAMIVDVFTIRSGTGLLILTNKGFIVIEEELYLWEILPINTRKFPLL